MRAPEQDVEARSVIWDRMQMFWMDTDPGIFLDGIADACAASGYSLDELQLIFWNEVRPAVSFNLLLYPAPEWLGFEEEWLRARVLKKHRFGHPLPRAWLDFGSRHWWRRLAAEVTARRAAA